jgi:predicted RNA binding protein YcfA (HicA-like mRNA interferase family)
MHFPDTGVKITIPNVHSGKDIAIPLQKLIIKQLDIDQKTFELL